jgi:hypothetical protein
VKHVKYFLIIIVILLASFVASLFLWPRDPVVACLDWGGRWNQEVSACECTDEKRSRPGFSETNKEYCSKSISNDGREQQ